MGDRANIYFKGGHIGVYGHWSGYEMPEAAMKVVENKAFKARLRDTSYATRIGVQTALEALDAKSTEETGFGLWTDADGECDNEHRFIVIDVQTGELYVTDNWRSPDAKDLIENPTLAKIKKAYE